jgi:periplasmic divalent cation tolerance protein
MPDAIVVLSTVPDRASGERIARELVERGLVGCAQLASTPSTSFYRWQGKLCVEDEWRLYLKSTADRWAALRDLLEELHPYDTAQILRLDATASDGYARWLCGGGSEEPT